MIDYLLVVLIQPRCIVMAVNEGKTCKIWFLFIASIKRINITVRGEHSIL